MLNDLLCWIFNKKHEGDKFNVKCWTCGNKGALGELSYFYGPGVAHVDAKCDKCGAIWEYDDFDITEA